MHNRLTPPSDDRDNDPQNDTPEKTPAQAQFEEITKDWKTITLRFEPEGEVIPEVIDTTEYTLTFTPGYVERVTDESNGSSSRNKVEASLVLRIKSHGLEIILNRENEHEVNNIVFFRADTSKGPPKHIDMKKGLLVFYIKPDLNSPPIQTLFLQFPEQVNLIDFGPISEKDIDAVTKMVQTFNSFVSGGKN